VSFCGFDTAGWHPDTFCARIGLDRAERRIGSPSRVVRYEDTSNADVSEQRRFETWLRRSQWSRLYTPECPS